MRKNLIVLASMVLAILLCLVIADRVQHSWGRVEITEGSIAIEDKGELTYKLYRPVNATEKSKAPAVLLLHGYQNDHETSAAYAIELAKRGAVVLCLDEYGHGSTSISMRNRGYVDHKVTVTYGMDSEADGTYVSIGGPLRYKVMMNFSNLSFFNERYTEGSNGMEITDSSMGGIAAYAFLSTLPYVDSSRMGISGHSMGTWASWSTAAAFSGTAIEPKATVLQCGELFTTDAYDSSGIRFNNVLLLTAQYDEFNYFRDYEDFITSDMIKSPLRSSFLGVPSQQAEWNTTFGSFADGSARRVELLNTNHRLATHDSHGMSTALSWFDKALSMNAQIAPESQTFMIKEVLVFVAMLLGIFSMLPLMNILLCLDFFKVMDRPLVADEKLEKPMKKWWKGAIITILIAACTYPFMTQLGHGLLPLPENIFRMTIGNGFLSWYLLLIVIMLITTLTGRKKAMKSGTYSPLSLGLSYSDREIDWTLMGKGALLALCMTAFMYLLVLVSSLFKLDFRFIWPFFKTFSLVRFGQMLIYIPVFALFFVLNNSKIFAQMRAVHSADRGAKGFLNAWWKNAFCMAGGILIVILLEYIPFFMGIAPGADLLFGTTFGGPFMSLLIVFFPQILVFSAVCTFAYRRTSSVYPGAFAVAVMACWIVTGGSALL